MSRQQLRSAPTVEFPPWAQIEQRRRAHVARVAAVCESWAESMKVSALEKARWQRAVALHDALKDAPAELLLTLASNTWGVPALLHGPAAAAMAARDGESDHGVLDAVYYHSVGYRRWDSVGRILFLADYLEPGRSYHTPRHAELLDRVPDDTESVLREVAAERIADVLLAGRPLLRETMEFWNGLVCE